ncbi:MAG: radical SAM family heme chaperone HemW [Clostridia bacterium]|nr:radical SAM family heme chaperone HemW [Clostridia bacterium]
MPGIYLHWPFCLSKCAYCSFVSRPDQSLAVPYAKALETEIRQAAGLISSCADTVFFGGGTPSLMRPDTLRQLVDAMEDSFGLARDAEITVEMNPRTAGQPWLETARRAGVNRLSMGLQAVQDHLLRLLGRRQSASDAAETFYAARRAGFSNLSLDLIYGIPGQTMAEWYETLEFAVGLGPQHLSLYALSLEPETPLAAAAAAGEIAPPDEDQAADMYVFARSFLTGSGFRQYEISNFSRPGFECRHNLKYWTLDDYLGFGAAAYSCLGLSRFGNISDISCYISVIADGGSAVSDREQISPRERQREFFMLRTRLTEGFSPAEFEQAAGVPFTETGRPGLRRAVELGLLRRQEERFVPTGRGLRLQNQLALLLMDDV